MPATAQIFIPHRNPDLRLAFPEAIMVNARSGAVAYFEDTINGDVVLWKMMPDVVVAGHIDDFTKYIKSLNIDEQAQKDAITALSFCRAVVTLETDVEFRDNRKIWAALFHLAKKFDGYVFVLDSLITSEGGVIFGPLGERKAAS